MGRAAGEVGNGTSLDIDQISILFGGKTTQGYRAFFLFSVPRVPSLRAPTATAVKFNQSGGSNLPVPLAVGQKMCWHAMLPFWMVDRLRHRALTG